MTTTALDYSKPETIALNSFYSDSKYVLFFDFNEYVRLLTRWNIEIVFQNLGFFYFPKEGYMFATESFGYAQFSEYRKGHDKYLLVEKEYQNPKDWYRIHQAGIPDKKTYDALRKSRFNVYDDTPVPELKEKYDLFKEEQRIK